MATRRQKPKHQKQKKIRTLDVILVIVFGIFLWFNYRMLTIYSQMGSIPEGYACAVVASLIGECGICGWIRNTKIKREEYEREKEEAKLNNKEKPQDSEEGGKG